MRSFCSRCGTPLTYETKLSPHMVNIPRALFSSRTGRQPLYHSAFSELRDRAYTGGRLVPLRGFPGIVWSALDGENDRDKMIRRKRAVAADYVETLGEARLLDLYLPRAQSNETMRLSAWLRCD